MVAADGRLKMKGFGSDLALVSVPSTDMQRVPSGSVSRLAIVKSQAATLVLLHA